MRLNRLTNWVVLSVGLNLLAISGPASAALLDPAVALNRKCAEEMFPSTPAERLIILHEDEPGDTKIGRCAAGGPLRLGDKVYPRGIGVNSQSTLRVELDRPASHFLAVIGLDRNVDNTKASCRFHVHVGKKEVWDTEILRANSAPRTISVPLEGAKEFDLIVDDAGDGRGWDQGDWADARVALEDGSELWLDNLPVDGGLPFSFVYGGKHSSEFLGHWTREVKVEKISDTTTQRTLTLTDPTTRLEVRAVCLVYQDTAGVDWTIHFTNKGHKDTPVIEQVKALDAAIAIGTADSVVLHRLNGAPCQADDWMPFDQPMVKGQRIEFAATNGRSSNVSPWFNADWQTGA